MTDQFQPHLTPSQMLELGVFGGSYFHGATEQDLMGLGLDCHLVVDNTTPFDKSRNRYGVKAGQSFAQWTAKGWIFPEDPLGWFHWYCRYSAGRRHHRDAHQMRRWVSYKLRWGNAALGKSGLGRPGPVVNQGLLQWGIDVSVLLGEQPSTATDTWDDYLRVTAGALDT